MYHLVIAVLSVGLLSLLMAGGMSYLPSDLPVRTETANRVATSHKLILSAMNSYRLANRGASPTVAPISQLDSTIWASEISPFIANGTPPSPEGMHWIYGKDAEGVVILCLTTLPGRNISQGVFEGLASVVSRSDGNMSLSGGCDNNLPITNFEGQAALIAAAHP